MQIECPYCKNRLNKDYEEIIQFRTKICCENCSSFFLYENDKTEQKIIKDEDQDKKIEDISTEGTLNQKSETISLERNDLNKYHILSYAGSILLIIGVFLPVISIPMFGSQVLFQGWGGDGLIIIIFAIVSIILTIINKSEGLWYSGLGVATIIFFNLIYFELMFSKMKNEMSVGLENNPFKGIAEMAMQSVRLEWGWAVLILGSIMILFVAYSSKYFQK